MTKTIEFEPGSLRYDAAGLIPCIAQEAETGEVLMMAWMNAEAVARTMETGASPTGRARAGRSG
jgi:phosphoribosyl-AMP cyclohydrolase